MKAYTLDAGRVITSDRRFPPIIGLLLHRGPSTIARLIVTLVVYAIKSSIFRHWSHIRQEISKFFPPFAKGYTPFSVILKGFTVGVTATLNHRIPAFIYSGFSSRCVASVSMLYLGRTELSTKATTTFGRVLFSSARKVAIVDRFFNSAVTPTNPVSIFRIFSYNDETIESLADSIYSKFGHGSDYTLKIGDTQCA